MAYEKFMAARGGQGMRIFGPYVTVNKGGMSFNSYARDMIGDSFKFVMFFFDREASKIGFWFWKDSCPGSYSLLSFKNREVFCVNSKSFFRVYGILEIVEKCNTRHFPFEKDEDNKQDKDFYCIQLKSAKGRSTIRKDG